MTDGLFGNVKNIGRQSEKDARSNPIWNTLKRHVEPGKALDIGGGMRVSLLQNLDSCTFEARNAPEEGALMIKRSRVQIGTDNGKPVYAQISGRTEAKRIDNAVKALIESGRIWDLIPEKKQQNATQRPNKGHSFSTEINAWYDRYKDKSAAETYKVTLKGRIKKLCEFFGNVPIEEVSVDMVQDFLNAIAHLTETTVDAFRKTLADFFADMCEDGVITRNPARSRRLMNPGIKNKGIVAYDKNTVRRLFGLIPDIKDYAVRMMLALMLFAGLRREEALGLRWDDVDFENNLLNIERAVVMPIDAPIVKGTKTGNNRQVPISDTLRNILVESRGESGFIVIDEKGRQFTKSRYKKLWSKAKTVTGIPDLDARALRHAYATYNASAGVDMKTLAICMGHSTMKTTMEIYTQLDESRLGMVRNVMPDYINN